MSRRPTALLVATACAVMLAATLTSAYAGPSPFGVGLPEAAPTPGGLFGGAFVWLAQRQAEFNRALYAALRLIRTDPAALWSLAGLGFVYGVLHAAGPGHGKAVVAAYLVATGETLRRGIALAFISAAVQALTAIILVGVATRLLNLTAVAVTDAAVGLELASGAAITVLGLMLLWRRLRRQPPAAACPPSTAPSPSSRPALRYRGAVVGPAEACAACGAIHPAATGNWRDALAAVLSVGLRPCTGAIIVLTFAFSLQLWWAGVFATCAMALGTGLTVASIATLTVTARGLAERMTGTRAVAPRLATAFGVAGAAAITLVGILILGAGIIGTTLTS
jgi:ABC-type nickel/cobalt efflux system permease component RcnA